jgi:hypothetical protein
MNFGIFMLTRQVHDLTFAVYGKALGLPPETIPPLVARAIAVDSIVVFAILGFRKRKSIIAWWKARQAPNSSASDLASRESLSSAP